MKISPKKKGEIYDLVHREIEDKIKNVEEYWKVTGNSIVDRDRIHFLISQAKIPLAQKIIKLLEGKTKE